MSEGLFGYNAPLFTVEKFILRMSDGEAKYYMLKLTVIIINYNTKTLTEQSVLRFKEELNNIPSQICIVDNGSTDGSVSSFQKNLVEIFLIENQINTGFAAACNGALNVCAKSEFYIFANSDTLPQEGSVKQMLSFMEKSPECSVLGPKLINPDGTMQNSFNNWPDFKSEMLGQKWFQIVKPEQYPHKRQLITKPLEVESVIGACFMVRRDDLIDAGGFDERYFFFLEETDLCRKMILKGKKVIYHPDFCVEHLQGASADKNQIWSRHYFYRSKYQFLQKWEAPFVFKIIFLRNIFMLCLKVILYFLLDLISLKNISRVQSKFKISLWLLKNHFLGFPPYLFKEDVDVFEDSSIKIVSDRSNSYITDITQFISYSKRMSKIKETNTSEIYVCSDEALNLIYIIKEAPPRHMIRDYFYGKLNYYNTKRLQSINLPVPDPVAFGHISFKTAKTKNFYLCNMNSSFHFLDNFLETFLEKLSDEKLNEVKKHFFKQLKETIVKMNQKMVFISDLKASDILVMFEQENGGFNFCFYFTNLEKVKYGYFFDRKNSIRNLFQELVAEEYLESD